MDEQTDSADFHKSEYIHNKFKASDISDIPELIHRLNKSKDKEAMYYANQVADFILPIYKAWRNGSSLYEKVKNSPIEGHHLERYNQFYGTRYYFEIRKCLFVIASLNGSGFIREPALFKLIETKDKELFPYIMLRLNDWVGTIRDKAKREVQNYIENKERHTFLICYKLVEQLNCIQRNDLAEIYSAIRKLLFSEEGIEQFLNMQYGIGAGERLYFYSNLISLDKVNSAVETSMLYDNYAQVRILALKYHRPEWHKLQKLLQDRNAEVRKQAISKITEKDLEHSWVIETIHEMLFDSNSFVRLQSRELMSVNSDINFYEIYKKKFVDNPSIGSMFGLSETGSKKDIDLIKLILKEQNIQLKAKAIIAIANLDEQIAKKIGYQYFKDESLIIKKACLNAISRSFNNSDLPKFRDLYSRQPENTKKIMLRIMRQFGGWSIIGDMLLGLKTSNLKLRNTAGNYLKSWFQYSMRLGTKLTSEDRKYVMAILSSFENHWFDKCPSDVQRIIKELPFIFRE